MTVNQEGSNVMSKLLMADATAEIPCYEPHGDEHSVTPQKGDYSLHDDSGVDGSRTAVEGVLPFNISQTETCMNESDSEAHQINSKGDKAHLPANLRTSILPLDVNSSCEEAVHLKQPEPNTGCYVSDDFWQHSNPVPKDEERLTILGEQHKCSDVTSFADSHKEGGMVSGYSLDMVTPIGSPTHDSWFRMPPIKTWPPVDSWSETCSNIVHIVLGGAGEPPAVIIQTLEVMAIKDKEVEPHQTQIDTKTAELMCVITAVKDSSEMTAERRVEKVQPRLQIQTADAHSPVCGDTEDREMPCGEEHTSQVTSEEARCSSPPCALAPQNLHERDITEILPSTENTTPAVSCDIAANITPIKGQMSIGREDLEIHEDSHWTGICSQTSRACLEKKPETEVLRRVTEDTLSALYEDIKETAARRRSHESLTFSSYSSQLSAKEPKPRKSLSSDTVPQRAAGSFQRLTRAPAPKSRGTLAGETDKGECSNREYLHAGQQPKKNESFEFIMPLAPTCPRSIHLNAAKYGSLIADLQRATFLKTDGNRTCDRSEAFSAEIQGKELLNIGNERTESGDFLAGEHEGNLAVGCVQSAEKDLFKPSSCEDLQQPVFLEKKSHETADTVYDFIKEYSNLRMVSGEAFVVCEESKTAYLSLDLNDPVGHASWPGVENGSQIDYISSLEHMKMNKTRSVCEIKPDRGQKMPQTASRTSSGSKKSGHEGKRKPAINQEKFKQTAAQASKKLETPIPESLVTGESPAIPNTECRAETDGKNKEMTENCMKSRGKKKKKQSQNSSDKAEAETLKDITSSVQPKPDGGSTAIFDISLAQQVEINDKQSALASQPSCLQKQKQSEINNLKAKVKGKCTFASPVNATDTDDSQSAGLVKQRGEYISKRRHVFETKDGKQLTESKHQKSVLVNKEKQLSAVAAGHRRAYNEVVKQKPQAPKEVPKVLQHIRAEKLSGDPGSISLQCQFSAVSVQSSVQWTREGAILEESKRSAGEERILSYIILKPTSKDLGRYQCCVRCPLGTLTSEFYLTSDVLSELVPSSDHQAVEVVDGLEEDVKCSPLLFKDDFLNEQYFGENQPASILTEQVHFGEGMHRRAFRTKLMGGMLPIFSPGHPCVLKVHNAISQGTKYSAELIDKNYSLAVEECSVQNTAREYIKAYERVAKSAAEFGEVPEIIPILLVHRPSSDIPYATLEEELMGDFVKYSVKDGKEINLTRRDSEPGQKCCAFQHWVYDKTEGNLLVTDMQGVGMKLTDVGIATPKKGYKGFKGNCATSFIEQFKALHQCNKFCELLGLNPLQPGQTKPRRTQPASNPKPPPQAKKKPFTVNLNSKS